MFVGLLVFDLVLLLFDEFIVGFDLVVGYELYELVEKLVCCMGVVCVWVMYDFYLLFFWLEWVVFL